MTDEYDVVVIGAGPAGENAAGRCAAANLSVAIVERERVGGECSFWACMPSKTLLRPGEVVAAARRVPGAREAITGSPDAPAAAARRDVVVAGYDDDGQARWVDSVGVELVRGTGRLSGERAVMVEVDGGARRSLRARRAVVLATGSVPTMPPIDGLADARPWWSRDATSATQPPRRLVVLGGGVVGVEMAQAWRRLGSEEVTIVEGSGRLLAHEEPFVGEDLAVALRAEGVTILSPARAARVRRNGTVAVTLEDGRELAGDEILVAVGRHPATHDVGLDAVGLRPGRAVDVDDSL